MSNRSERLFSSLNQISDTHIDEAAEFPQQRHTHWKQWGTAAACVTLAVMTASIFPHLGGCGAGGGDSGHEGGSTFMSYAGPILPLRLREEAPGITAERTVTLDFTPWVPQWWTNEQEATSREWLTPQEQQKVLEDYDGFFPEGGLWLTSSDMLIRDTYVLTNSSNQDQAVTIQLPFIGDLLTLDSKRPVLTLDGNTVDTELLIGRSHTDFEFSSWEDVDAQLADGRYRTTAQQGVPAYDSIPVLVYGYQNEVLHAIPRTDDEGMDVSNSFDLDYGRTGVLDFNYDGGTFDREGSHMERNFSLPKQHDRNSSHFLIVLGEDLQNFTSQLSGDAKQDVPFVRTEADLDAVLRYALQEFLEMRFSTDGNSALSDVSFEQYYTLLRQTLPQEDLLNFNSDIHLSGGILLDYMNQLFWQDRIFWVQAELTIPAGESRTLTAHSRKESSVDFACAKTENQDIYGYDLMPWLDSNLHFTSQTAVLEDREQIEIVRQNFGFDLENAVKSVALTPDEVHYYLEVRRSSPIPTKPPAS